MFGFAFIYFERIVSFKIYDKRDDFDYDIVNFPFLDGDVPRSTSYGVYITETSPYLFGNFGKLSLYNCCMPIQLINSL